MLFGVLVNSCLFKLKRLTIELLQLSLESPVRLAGRCHVCLCRRLNFLVVVHTCRFAPFEIAFKGASSLLLLWVSESQAGLPGVLASVAGSSPLFSDLAVRSNLRWAKLVFRWWRMSHLSSALIYCFSSPAVLRLLYILTFIIWRILSATDNFPQSWRQILIHAFLSLRLVYLILSPSTL